MAGCELQGRFSAVFDWLRKVHSTDSTSGGASAAVSTTHYIYNSYFFRGRRYWMYENRYNRTRFGDPLDVRDGWSGLPETVDTCVQVITPSAGDAAAAEYTIDTYFFSGQCQNCLHSRSYRRPTAF